MKKHLKNSNSSIADLCSEEFLSYIKNPLNLKESFKKSHNYNEQIITPKINKSEFIPIEKNYNTKENFINNGVYMTRTIETSNSNNYPNETIDIYNKINNEKSLEIDRSYNKEIMLPFKNVNHLLKCKSIDLKNKTSQFDHEKQKLSNKNRNIRNFINTSVTFDNSADLKNNTYDEKYIKSNPNEKQNKFSIFSKNKMKKYFNIK